MLRFEVTCYEIGHFAIRKILIIGVIFLFKPMYELRLRKCSFSWRSVALTWYDGNNTIACHNSTNNVLRDEDKSNKKNNNKNRCRLLIETTVAIIQVARIHIKKKKVFDTNDSIDCTNPARIISSSFFFSIPPIFPIHRFAFSRCKYIQQARGFRTRADKKETARRGYTINALSRRSAWTYNTYRHAANDPIN